MKKIVFILSIMVLVIISCEGRIDYQYWTTYEYHNKSSKNISIICYYNSVNRKTQYTHHINRDDKLVLTSNDDNMDDPALGIIFGSDSVKIIFDNERQSTFAKYNSRNTESPYNIYSGMKQTSGHKKYKMHTFLEYTFTDKDYEYAKPCNGKCN